MQTPIAETLDDRGGSGRFLPELRARLSQRGAGFGGWCYCLHLATVFGIALSNGLLALSLLALPWAQRKNWSAVLVAARGLLLPLGLYALAFAISALLSRNRAISLDELGSAVFTLTTLPLALIWVRSERHVRWVLNWMTVLVVGISVMGILQFVFTDFGPIHNRIPGPFSHYMTYSGVLLVGNCLLLARLASHVSGADPPWASWSLWGGLIIVNLALLLTLTRHTWIATIAVAAVAVILRARRWLPWFLALLVVFGIGLRVASPTFWERVTSIVSLDVESNYDRICMVWAGAEMVAERPLYGQGPGMVAELYPIYRHPTSPRLRVQHLHNTLVQMAAERGLVEVLAYLWLMIASFVLAWRELVREGGRAGPRADLFLAVLFAVGAFNLAGLFEANWRDTEVQRLMLFVLAVPWCLRVARELDSTAE